MRNHASKANLYLYFLTQQNLLISGKKMLMSAELKGCVMELGIVYAMDMILTSKNLFIKLSVPTK